jgi:hypothetical protein
MRTVFNHVREPLPKDWGICSTCAEHSARAKRGFTDSDEKARWLGLHAVHVLLHKSERENYVSRVSQCQHSASLFALMTFDYTRACPVPYFMPNITALRRLTPMQVMIGGLISFSDDRSYLFAHTQGVPKGGNLICTILYHCLRALFSSGGIASSTRWLQCQCDGGSENINKTVLAFFAVMIAKGWVSKVTIHRLVVGHTHSQIDQLFHAVRAGVRRKAIGNVVDVLDLMRSAHTGGRVRLDEICWIDAIGNWDEWFQPYFVNHIHGHTKPLCICITASPHPSQPPVWRWKASSFDPVWLGEGIDAIADVQVLTAIPPPRHGQPSMIVDNYMPDEDVQKCLDRAKRFVKDEGDGEWLEAMKGGSRAAIHLLTNNRFDDGKIGVAGLLSCGRKRITVRLLSTSPVDMFAVPSNRAPADASQLPALALPAPSVRHHVWNRSIPHAPKVLSLSLCLVFDSSAMMMRSRQSDSLLGEAKKRWQRAERRRCQGRGRGWGNRWCRC